MQDLQRPRQLRVNTALCGLCNLHGRVCALLHRDHQWLLQPIEHPFHLDTLSYSSSRTALSLVPVDSLARIVL